MRRQRRWGRPIHRRSRWAASSRAVACDMCARRGSYLQTAWIRDHRDRGPQPVSTEYVPSEYIRLQTRHVVVPPVAQACGQKTIEARHLKAPNLCSSWPQVSTLWNSLCSPSQILGMGHVSEWSPARRFRPSRGLALQLPRELNLGQSLVVWSSSA